MLVVGGCYRYTPVHSVPAPGVVVRLVLTPAGALALTPTLGVGTIAVEGMVIGATDTAYVVAMSGTRKGDDAQVVVWAGEHVIIPRTAVDHTEERALDRRRTMTAAGVVLLAAIAVKLIVAGFTALSGGDEVMTGSPPP